MQSFFDKPNGKSLIAIILNMKYAFCIEIDYSLHFMKLIKIPKDVEGRRWRRLWLFYISSFFMPFSRDDNGAWKGGGQVWEMNGRSRIPHLRAWGLRLLTICIYICIASRRWFMRSAADSLSVECCTYMLYKSDHPNICMSSMLEIKNVLTFYGCSNKVSTIYCIWVISSTNIWVFISYFLTLLPTDLA